MKDISILLLLVVTLCVHHILGDDRCGHGESVRCGEDCTGPKGFCTCGYGAKKFNYQDNTTWCCNASDCEKKGADIVCRKGNTIPLTTPCNGKCNTASSYYAGRQYKMCDSKDQCVKIQYWQDKEYYDCEDHSDEKKEDAYSPIQWAKLTTCYQDIDDNLKLHGVKCSGQRLQDDCLPYSRWCHDDRTVLQCQELEGRTSVHTEVCSNKTFWIGKPCKHGAYEGRRCNDGYIGQCYYPDTKHRNDLAQSCTNQSSHGILQVSGSSSVLVSSAVTILSLLIMLQRCMQVESLD